MREYIFLHIGQAGIQIGDSLWDEHKIGQERFSENNFGRSVIFNETRKGKFVPRCIFIDLEKSVGERVMKSKRGLFEMDQFFLGKEDAANNFVRGHFSLGEDIIDEIVGRIENELEKCEKPEGIVFVNALGGGTGSGLGTLLVDRLGTNYPKLKKLGFQIVNSPNISPSTVEPYNFILSLELFQKYLDFICWFDNEALYKVCETKLGSFLPNYKDINSIISRVVSDSTCSLRFQEKNSTIGNFKSLLNSTEPEWKIVCPSISPLYGPEMVRRKVFSVKEMLKSAYTQNNLFSVDVKSGFHISSHSMFRGDISSKDIQFSMSSLPEMEGINFRSKSPEISYGLNFRPPVCLKNSIIGHTDRSLTTMTNTTSIVPAMNIIRRKFSKMYLKSAFVHWYVGDLPSDVWRGMVLGGEDVIRDYKRMGNLKKEVEMEE